LKIEATAAAHHGDGGNDYDGEAAGLRALRGEDFCPGRVLIKSHWTLDRAPGGHAESRRGD